MDVGSPRTRFFQRAALWNELRHDAIIAGASSVDSAELIVDVYLSTKPDLRARVDAAVETRTCDVLAAELMTNRVKGIG